MDMTWRRGGALLVFGLVGLMACGGEKAAEEVPAEEAPAAEAAAPAAAENVIPAEQLLTGAAGLRGQKVTVQDVTVQGPFGTKGFWIQLPNPQNPTAGGSPFLVRTEGPVPAQNAKVDVTGTVTAMAPETAGEWLTAGSITENDKPLAEFATEYIVAETVTTK